MAHDHFDDEDDVYGDTSSLPSPRKGRNPALLVGLMLGGVLLVGLVLCGGLLFLFRVAMPPEPPVKVAVVDGEVGARPVSYTKKDFEDRVRGKTRDEVMAAVRGPDEVQKSSPDVGKGAQEVVDAVERPPFGFDWWVYHDRVTNESTGKPYPTVRVRFNDRGRVDRIEYP